MTDRETYTDFLVDIFIVRGGYDWLGLLIAATRRRQVFYTAALSSDGRFFRAIIPNIFVYEINRRILFDCHRHRYRTDSDKHYGISIIAVLGGELSLVDVYPSSTVNVVENGRRRFYTRRMLAVGPELNVPPPGNR